MPKVFISETNVEIAAIKAAVEGPVTNMCPKSTITSINYRRDSMTDRSETL